MAENLVLIEYPPDVIADIDQMVGQGKRTSYLVELATRDVKLRRQREGLREAKGAWKPEDHPELVQGAAAWVNEIRALDGQRFEEIDERLLSHHHDSAAMHCTCFDRIVLDARVDGLLDSGLRVFHEANENKILASTPLSG